MATEYIAEKFKDHEQMQEGLNKRAAEGWEPLHYAIQASQSVRIGWHYVIFARMKP